MLHSSSNTIEWVNAFSAAISESLETSSCTFSFGSCTVAILRNLKRRMKEHRASGYKCVDLEWILDYMQECDAVSDAEVMTVKLQFLLEGIPLKGILREGNEFIVESLREMGMVDVRTTGARLSSMPVGLTHISGLIV